MYVLRQLAGAAVTKAYHDTLSGNIHTRVLELNQTIQNFKDESATTYMHMDI